MYQVLSKIHWRMLILVFTRMLRGKILTRLSWPLTYEVTTLRINMVSVILRSKYVPSFIKNPLKDVDSRVFTRMWRMDGSVTTCISLRNFVGKGIKSSSNDNSLNRKPLYEKFILISLYHVYVDNSKIVKYNFGFLN